jgi:hypothetical protein
VARPMAAASSPTRWPSLSKALPARLPWDDSTWP